MHIEAAFGSHCDGFNSFIFFFFYHSSNIPAEHARYFSLLLHTIRKSLGCSSSSNFS